MSEPATPRAAILSIGDELLRGAHPDLNAPHLARELIRLGFRVERTTLLGDDVEPLTAGLRALTEQAELVVTSGGLGPTLDDLTREAVAAVAGVELEERSEVWHALRERWAARGLEVPPSNRRQALVPRGAELLPNEWGTAPGFLCELAPGRFVASLPGPPRELRPMVAEVLAPRLRERFDGLVPAPRRTFVLAGLAESTFGERCGEWMRRSADPLIGVSAREGLLVASLHPRDPSDPAARTRLEARADEFRQRFARWCLYEGDASIEAHLIGRLAEGPVTLALAESCTGGRVAARLTAVPGASDVFREGFVTYSNAAKQARLGVDGALLDRFGAVSGEVAAAMARGAAKAAGADLSVSITGIAGPSGGSPEKPVGLVWLGLHHAGLTWILERRFPAGDRERVRSFATHAALELALRAVDGRLGELDLLPG